MFLVGGARPFAERCNEKLQNERGYALTISTAFRTGVFTGIDSMPLLRNAFYGIE